MNNVSNKMTVLWAHTTQKKNLVDTPSENLERIPDGTSGTDGTNETDEVTENEHD